MRPVSAQFLRIVRGSHSMAARARVVSGHPTGVNPTGTIIPIIDGDVLLDANADIRGTLDLTTDGTRMWPASSTDLLTPYGNEIFVERGIVFGSGAVEWVSQGYYRIDDVEQDGPPNGPIRIAGKDRMAGIVDAKLLVPRQFNVAASFQSVVESLVLEVYPTATILYDFDAANTLLGGGGTHIAEDDRHKFLDDLVRSRGKVMYWDHEGKLRIESPPNPQSPIFDIDAGTNGVLVSMSRSLSRQGVYNAVIATGEAPGTSNPVRAVATDISPTSPTYWHGPFGKVPRLYSSPFITTQTQAAEAAEAMLLKSLGLPYNIDFQAVPNPALEALDPVRVRRPDGDELHVLESVRVPLTARNTMSATTRQKTNMLIEVI